MKINQSFGSLSKAGATGSSRLENTMSFKEAFLKAGDIIAELDKEGKLKHLRYGTQDYIALRDNFIEQLQG